MANKYWVGGTGTWDATSGHWATTSGGAGTAPAPTSADAVFFTNLSGTGVVTISSAAVCAGMNVTSVPTGLSFYCPSGNSVNNYAGLTTDTTARSGATFTGSISGTTLTVTAVASGTILINSQISGANVSLYTSITAQVSGTTGGIGVYTVDTSQTAASATIITVDSYLNMNFVAVAPTTTVTATNTSTNFLGAVVVNGDNITYNLALGQAYSLDQYTGTTNLTNTTTFTNLVLYGTSYINTTAYLTLATGKVFTLTGGYFENRFYSDAATYGSSTVNLTGATLNIGTNSADDQTTSSFIINSNTVSLTTSSATAITVGYRYCAYQTTTNFNVSNKSFLGTVTLNNSNILLQAYSGTTTANTFGTLNVNGGVNKFSTFQFFADINCTNFNIIGNSPINRLFLSSDVLGTRRNLNSNSTVSPVMTNVDLKDISITNSGFPVVNVTYTSVGDLNSGGFSPNSPASGTTLYAVTGSSNVNWSGTMWATSSGGVATSQVPLAQDSVIFDNLSGTGYVALDLPNFPKVTVTSGYIGQFSLYSGGAAFFPDGSLITTTSTTGDFSITSTLAYSISNNQAVIVTGTNTGGSGLTAGKYKISATNNNSTFKLVKIDGTAITTINAKPSTGLTFTVPNDASNSTYNIYGTNTGSTVIPDDATVQKFYNPYSWLTQGQGYANVVYYLWNRTSQTLPYSTSYYSLQIQVPSTSTVYTLSNGSFIYALRMFYGGTLAFGSATVTFNYLAVGASYLSITQTSIITATAGSGTAITGGFQFSRDTFLQTNLTVNQTGQGNFYSNKGGFYLLKFSNSTGSRTQCEVQCDSTTTFAQGWSNTSANITLRLSTNSGANYFNVNPFNIIGNTTYNVNIVSYNSGAQVSLTIPSGSSTYYIAYQDINAANTIRAYGNGINLGNNTNILFIQGGASFGYVIG